MAVLILQYKDGTGPLFQDDFETPAGGAAFEPYVREANTFTHRDPDPAFFSPDVTDGDLHFATPQTTSGFEPSIESTSGLTGGHEDPNAWWTNSFGDSDCDTELNQIVLIKPIPTWYTTTQYTNRYIFLDVGDPC